MPPCLFVEHEASTLHIIKAFCLGVMPCHAVLRPQLSDAPAVIDEDIDLFLRLFPTWFWWY